MFGLYLRNSTVGPNFSPYLISNQGLVILILGLGDREEENSKLEL
jgi:hypothetical protein